jgi:hypothetical protein
MIKFTFNKGEGEYALVGVGVLPYDSSAEYEVAGNWSPPLEDGKVPVELMIAYTRDDCDSKTELKGVFDPEENSLRGITVIPNSGVTGDFVFKRDPDLVRSCPAPSVINARKRWEFAGRLVRDRLRRHSWSSKRILDKIKDRKRFVELYLRKLNSGVERDEKEEEELSALCLTLHEADLRFYYSKVLIDSKSAPVFL